ncbi:MAG: hypothetical protein KDJ36_03215 [Hyphomicrobiaceae bacterium]|nr:hypothetical protein [Hyphomicrobiaceae bacterium]
MQDFLRDRLSKDEIERYELYDGLAVICTQFMVWPGLLGLICYASQMRSAAFVCWAIAAVALPLMLLTGQRARALLKVAEKRYLAIMGVHDLD